MKHYIALAFWTALYFTAVFGILLVFSYLHEWDKQMGINLDREGAQNVRQTVLSTGN